GADDPGGHWCGLEKLRLLRAVPGVIALESQVEIEYVDELVARILGLAEQKAEVDEAEHDVADVGSGADAPVLEDDARHHAVALERQLTARVGQLDAGDVAPHRELGLTHLERGAHEQVRLPVKARLGAGNPVQYAF